MPSVQDSDDDLSSLSSDEGTIASSSRSRSLAITHHASTHNHHTHARAEGDDEEEEEESEEEEDQLEQPYEEDELEEEDDDDEEEDQDEYDDADDSPAPRKKSTARSSRATLTRGGGGASTSGGGGGGVKIKFKLGGNTTTSSSRVTLTGSTGSSRNSSPVVKRSGGGKLRTGSGGKKRKYHQDDDSDDLDDSDVEAEEDDELLSDATASSSGTMRLTARQRAKEKVGEYDTELQSLSNESYRYKPKPGLVELTAEEAQAMKIEKAKKRKEVVNQKLEEEKTETINRLLKKQVGPRTKSKLSTVSTPLDATAGLSTSSLPLEALIQPYQVIPVIPTRYRYMSSIRSGEYSATLGIPVGHQNNVTVAEDVPGLVAKSIVYPGPRPPLKTRRFERSATTVV